MKDRTTWRILVAGANGRTGREILRELKDTSLYVWALTQSAANHESLVASGAEEVVVGDLLNIDEARAAVENCDAVLFTAGSTVPTGPFQPSPKSVLHRSKTSGAFPETTNVQERRTEHK